ncbi:MAG TPA: hypothetical protein VHX92_00975 [Rhizomicrobium sp.]|nr:hypothetical protein [Rhizomicrobium sp.]
MGIEEGAAWHDRQRSVGLARRVADFSHFPGIEQTYRYNLVLCHGRSRNAAGMHTFPTVCRPPIGLGSTMPERRSKTISYRRALWFTPAQVLQDCVTEALQKLTTVPGRTILYSGQHVRCAKTQNSKGGLLLHLTAETPGEFASVVPKVKTDATEIDLKSEKPPTDGEWLDGDAFVYIKGDHICLCTTSMRDGPVKIFFWELFAKAKMAKEKTKFDLVKVADIKKVNLVKKAGVKELEIRATLFKATADYNNRKSQAIGFAGALGKHMKAFLGKPNDVNDDGLKVGLVFKTDKRFGAKAVALGESEIETLAADLIKNVEKDHEHYDYVIKTNKGQRITLEEIFMKSTVEIEAHGKTVQCNKAWKELVKFYEGLEETGALEE